MTKTLLTIDIEVEGEFPNRKEMANRTKLEKRIDAEGIGKFAGSGGGLGAMDIAYLVDNESAAIAKIERLIVQILPDVKYTIDAEEFDGDESDLLEDDFELSIPRLIVFVFQIAAVLGILGFVIWKTVAWIF